MAEPSNSRLMKNINHKMIDSYRQLFKQHGYSPKSLGWDKGKQFLRFHQLTSDWDLQQSSVLDVGCGFGDFNKYLQLLKIDNYSYLGIDVVEDFIIEAKKHYSDKKIEFVHLDFMDLKSEQRFDYAIASGTFNHKIDGVDGYDMIYENMRKMLEYSNRAISIDFISDKVDYRHEHNFNSSPEKILTMAYGFSRNVILKNNYFPFEFSITIYKDDSFRKESTIFSEIEKKMAWLQI